MKTAPGDYRGQRLKKGTRMLRMRTARRVPWQGQPDRPFTNPNIPHVDLPQHVCAECFGPRSAYQDGQFCYQCEVALFGDGRTGYTHFIRSERQRRIMAERKGKPLRPKVKAWSPNLRNLDLPEFGARVAECLRAENVGGPEWRAMAVTARARLPRSRR